MAIRITKRALVELPASIAEAVAALGNKHHIRHFDLVNWPKCVVDDRERAGYIDGPEVVKCDDGIVNVHIERSSHGLAMTVYTYRTLAND